MEEAILLVLAGMDTTSTAVTNLVLTFGKNKEIVENLREELINNGLLEDGKGKYYVEEKKPCCT